ncbi:hypothetical protein KR786_002713 [Enterococcus faecium]|nr:hypothetical protein [Enterococcus faecium]
MLGVIILPFIAILFDLVAAAAYFLQLNYQTSGILFIGMIFQGVITLLLLVMMLSYKGKRYVRIQTKVFVKYVSIRYGIIILSFLVNAIVLFLYVLNYLDINPLIFSR